MIQITNLNRTYLNIKLIKKRFFAHRSCLVYVSENTMHHLKKYTVGRFTISKRLKESNFS